MTPGVGFSSIRKADSGLFRLDERETRIRCLAAVMAVSASFASFAAGGQPIPLTCVNCLSYFDLDTIMATSSTS